MVRDDGSGSDSVQCITDLSTYCSGAQGNHCGDWYFSDGTRLPRYLRVSWREFLYIIETMLTHQLVFIVAVLCTNAVYGHHYNSERESVFVGLYGNNRGC